MRIAVFGAGGTLGRAAVDAVTAAGHMAIPYTRAQCDIGQRADVKIRFALDDIEAVINCAGVLPERHGPHMMALMALANAAGPHIIADETVPRGLRFVHVSTDGVFSGITDHDDEEHRYKILDAPTPVDFYGQTKLTGEPVGPGVVVVRTSFVGPESGLLRWLLTTTEKEVSGWRHAWWTGSTQIAVARRLVEFATMGSEGIDDRGLLIHLATKEKINKYEVLRLCAAVFGLKVKVIASDTPYVDRALEATVPLPALHTALPELVSRWEKGRAGSSVA